LNVANLMLARYRRRRRELSVTHRARRDAPSYRISIARRNAAPVAIAGGLLGLVVASWAARALVAIAVPATAPLIGLRLDVRVLAVALALSMLAGFACAIGPAFAARRAESRERVEQRGTDCHKWSWARPEAARRCADLRFHSRC